MPAQNVEIVFVIDTSDSMQPYIDGLKKNLENLISPLRQTGLNVSFGLVAHSVTGHGIYSIQFLKPCNAALLKQLYSGQYNINDFFTSDPIRFKEILDGLTTRGDENTTLLLILLWIFPSAH